MYLNFSAVIIGCLFIFIAYRVFKIYQKKQIKKFDPYIRFEEIKLRNFKNSSRLEGIDIQYPSKELTIEEVIKKYTKVS